MHPLDTYLPIEVTLDGIITSSNDVQFLNTDDPMCFIVDGIVIFFSDE